MTAAATVAIAGASPAPDGPPIVRIDPGTLASVKGAAIAELPFMQVTAGRGATTRELEVFKSKDGVFDIGLASYDKVTLAIKDWPVDEYMHILSGKLEIVDKGGSHVFGPGQAFVMPKGFNGTWRVIEPVKKIAIVYNPK